VQHRLKEETPGGLPALFQALAAAPGTVACLAAGARWLGGCSEGLELPLNALVTPLLPLIEGKGGGRGRLLQGTALRPEGWAEFCARLAAAVQTAGCAGVMPR